MVDFLVYDTYNTESSSKNSLRICLKGSHTDFVVCTYQFRIWNDIHVLNCSGFGIQKPYKQDVIFFDLFSEDRPNLSADDSFRRVFMVERYSCLERCSLD